MLKIVPMIMKNQRPTIAWRIWSAASRALSSRNRLIDAVLLAERLRQQDPADAEASPRSCAVISASDFWVSPLTSRRTLPTRNVRYMKNGSRPSDRSVSRQSMRNIAMTVLIAIARLLVTELAVSVTTDWTPPTSLASRLWISPVRVSVKNRSGMRWRCA